MATKQPEELNMSKVIARVVLGYGRWAAAGSVSGLLARVEASSRPSIGIIVGVMADVL
jgi:hypothetical protein